MSGTTNFSTYLLILLFEYHDIMISKTGTLVMPTHNYFLARELGFLQILFRIIFTAEEDTEEGQKLIESSEIMVEGEVEKNILFVVLRIRSLIFFIVCA